jgi:hypothetical protein
MSTQQPMTSAERVALRRGRVPSVAKQVLFLLVGACCAVVVAVGLLNAIQDDPPLWALAAIPCGIVLFALLLAVQAWSMNAVFGVSRASDARLIVRPGLFLTTICASGGVATWLCAQSRPGVPEIAYLLPLILAVVFACLALLASARRAARRRASGRVMRTTTTGVITDDGLAEFQPGPNAKLARITVRFVDRSGQERWVQPLARQLDVRPLALGDEVTVEYDPDAAGDLRRVVVSADNGVSAVLAAKVR